MSSSAGTETTDPQLRDEMIKAAAETLFFNALDFAHGDVVSIRVPAPAARVVAAVEPLIRADERSKIVAVNERNAAYIREFAEEHLYDGDSDRALRGYTPLFQFAERLEAGDAS